MVSAKLQFCVSSCACAQWLQYLARSQRLHLASRHDTIATGKQRSASSSRCKASSAHAVPLGWQGYFVALLVPSPELSAIVRTVLCSSASERLWSPSQDHPTNIVCNCTAPKIARWHTRRMHAFLSLRVTFVSQCGPTPSPQPAVSELVWGLSETRRPRI